MCGPGHLDTHEFESLIAQALSIVVFCCGNTPQVGKGEGEGKGEGKG